MKRNKKRNALILILLFILVNITLTACVGKEIEKSNVNYKCKNGLDFIVMENNCDEGIYAKYNILFLDNDENIIYKESCKTKLLLKEEKESVNLKDIIPDYIAYDTVKNIDVEIQNVYEINIFFVFILLLIFTGLFTCFLFWLFTKIEFQIKINKYLLK